MSGYTDIVVGAGSAGSVIAARLSAEADRRTLLIEAGPDYPDPAALPRSLRDGYKPALDGHDWGWSIQGPLGRAITAPRGRVVGGCSAVNSCIALRPEPADFDELVAWGIAGWSWQEVLSAFVAIEHDHDFAAPYHGNGGPVPVRRWNDDEMLALSLGVADCITAAGYPTVRDLNEPDTTGVGPVPMNLAGRDRVSAADAYISPVRDAPNLTIRADTMVNRVLIRDGRAVGVEVVTPSGAEKIPADRVTLCAGAYGTPAILLRSGIGPADDLRAVNVPVAVDLPGVGANLQDHSQCYAAMIARPGVTGPNAPCVQVLLRYTAEGSLFRNDMQMCVLNWVDIGGYAPDLALAVGSSPPVMLTVLLQRPLSRGRVALLAADPRTAPAITLDYCADPEDLRRYRDGMRLVWRFARSRELSPFLDGPVNLDEDTVRSDAALDHFVRGQVQTAHHPVGTARMGPASDPDAVVDDRCRVHGVESLRIADAAILPTIVRANTNLTCLMIGERVANWLAAE